MESVTAFIGMGSNLGDGRANLLRCWNDLGKIEGIETIALSSPYMTAPVDMKSQHWFTNAVGRLKVQLTPLDLLGQLLQVEISHGRERHDSDFGYKDRVLDLDLLYYSQEVMDVPELTLPHPRIRERLFVLSPFAEIDPGFKDTLSGQTISSMEAELKERLLASGRQQEIIRASWEKDEF